jgi:hypothetical protein
MANFTSQHLAFAGYAQTIIGTNFHNEITEGPYINKTEEMEVVNFCNQFLAKYNVPQTKTSFQKVEGLLQHSIVENEIYREQLLEWIATNWVKI